ncbi:hypothetical protein NLG97_g7315 [Lecanicillium saksenae]|uniref:Uncharacterized protein n=1 Tax=Lecanicillium saksenae TaxID=468837 RepID=A0ACC1QM53_9HYPO|nr:hypothetical protein NLG97_g7315 [Lecanicillium saksenae]
MVNTSDLLQLPLWRPEAYVEDASPAERIALSYERARSVARLDRSDLAAVLKELESFDAVGEFMLTEVGHGLDARHIETTATEMDDGSFDLHTPNIKAAKSMPPATPYAKMPHRRRVTSRLLPSRPGAKVIDHAITSFTHVRLEASALLGSLDAPENERKDFFSHIHRVSVGTLSLSMVHIPIIRLSAYILGRYSQRRCVTGPDPGQQIPVVYFSTQNTPILTALTCASVFDAYATTTITGFMEAESPQIRSSLATIFKQTITHSVKALYPEMIDRCGWQGLYNHNQLQELALTMQGNSVAEGDILVLCIKMVSEVFLGRYDLPKTQDPRSLLAQHEMGIWQESGELAMAAMIKEGSNRNDEFNKILLPRVRKLVLATGQRAAYEAAAASEKVTPAMLKLFEATCLLDDASWYVENKKVTSAELYSRHADAVAELLPSLETLLQDSGASPWATAPILREDSWIEFIERLPTFGHEDTSRNIKDAAVSQSTDGSSVSDIESKKVGSKIRKRTLSRLVNLMCPTLSFSRG